MDALYADRSIVRGTCTGGAAGNFVDSSAALPGATADHFDYAFVKITSTTDNLAPQGEIRAISAGGYTAASGTFAVSNNFTAAPESGDTYEIHYGGHPNWLDRLLNKYARNFHYKTTWPLSLHIFTNDDNDMEDTTAFASSSAWDSANATGTKVTQARSASPTVASVWNGKQSLRVADSGSGNGYVYAKTGEYFQAAESRDYYSAVMCRTFSSSHTALFRMYDQDTSAALATSATVSSADWVELILQWTSTSTGDIVSPHFVSVSANGSSFWDDYQTWSAQGHIYPLPSWITRKEQVKEVVAYPAGAAAQGADKDYYSNESQAKPISGWKFAREDYGAQDELTLWVPSPGLARPYVICERPIAEVTYDYGTAGVGAGTLGSPANTIPLDSQTSDLLVAGVLSEAFLELAGRASNPSQYEKLARYHGAIWATAMNDLKPRSFKQKSNRTLVQM